MKKNPRLITMAGDETLWLYSASPADLTTLFTDPGSWVTTNIGNSARSATKTYFVQFATRPGQGDGEMLFTGISGTSMIIVTGHEGAAERFNEGLGLSTGSGFWASLDAALLKIRSTTEIELFVIEDERKIFIHVELGSDSAFLATLMSATANDEQGFLDWVMNTSGPLPRSAKAVNEDGSMTPIDMSAITLIPRGTFGGGASQEVKMHFENLSAGLCPPTCPILVACNGTQGSILAGTVADGNLVCQLDTIIIKLYCETIGGMPCPG
ncbi:MAG: hypothetical protein ABL949_07145 [Fimbriimonadaceae bacterium]